MSSNTLIHDNVDLRFQRKIAGRSVGIVYSIFPVFLNSFRIFFTSFLETTFLKKDVALVLQTLSA